MKPQTEIQPVEAPVLSPERQLLWDAANVIEREGWGQGKGLACPEIGHCVISALNKAEGVAGPDFFPAINLFRRYVGNAPDQWNDAPGRTAAEVIATMRACALEG